jgi:S1-C subfamily serine protease
MKKGLAIAFFSLGALALLFSCAHQPALSLAEREYQSMSIQQLQALSTEDPESCLEAISALKEEGIDDPVLLSSWGAIEEKALGSLIERYGKEEAEGRWAEAERSLASLEAAQLVLAESETLKKYLGGGKGVLDKARLRLLKGRSEEFYAKGLYAPGVNYLNRFLDLLESSNSAQALADEAYLKLWLERSGARGDSFSSERLISLLRRNSSSETSKGGDSRPEQASAPPDSPKASLAQLAEGVVTVHVDKGLKLKQGLGYPDRVLGSAFQVDGQGYYLSNYHVIASEVDPEYEGYSSLSVRPFDKNEARIPGKVVGWNQAMDVALIKSEASARTLYLHSIKDPAKGSRVYSIGSPAGLENSVSAGIISSPGRRILARGEALQIDVSVNPGSSGGPLLDEEGRVVGLIFAGLSGYQGLNFALPASWVSQLLPSLFTGGEIELSWIGLGLARTLDERLEISFVSPWRRAVKPGDSLVAIDGRPVKELSLAQYLLTDKPLHALSALSISREGKTRTLLVKTRAMPGSPMIEQAKKGTLEALIQGATGMLLEHVSGSRGPGGSYRILKLWPGLPADESGLREGDLIKFVRFRENYDEGVASFDISVKSPASGYLQKTMRLLVSLEMNNFI